MNIVMTSDGTQIQMFADWTTSHAQYVTVNNGLKSESIQNRNSKYIESANKSTTLISSELIWIVCKLTNNRTRVCMKCWADNII